MVSLLIASPDVIFLTTQPIHEEDNIVYSDCTYSWPESNTKIYQLCIVSLLFIGPFVLMSISYSHIVNVLWRDETMAEAMANSFHLDHGRKTNECNSTTEQRTNLSANNNKHSKLSTTQIVIDSIESSTSKLHNQEDVGQSANCHQQTNRRFTISHNALPASTTRLSDNLQRTNSKDEAHRPADCTDSNLSSPGSRSRFNRLLSNCQCKSSFYRIGRKNQACDVEAEFNKSSSIASTTLSMTMQTRQRPSLGVNTNELSATLRPSVQGQHTSTNPRFSTIVECADKENDKFRTQPNNSSKNPIQSALLDVSDDHKQTTITELDHGSCSEALKSHMTAKVGGQLNGVKIPNYQGETPIIDFASPQQRDDEVRENTGSDLYLRRDVKLNCSDKVEQFCSFTNSFHCATETKSPDDIEGETILLASKRKTELISASAKDAINSVNRITSERIHPTVADTDTSRVLTTTSRSSAWCKPLNVNDQMRPTKEAVDGFSGNDLQCINDNIKSGDTNTSSSTRLSLSQQKSSRERNNSATPSSIGRDCSTALKGISGLSRPIVTQGRAESTNLQCCGCFARSVKSKDKCKDILQLDTTTSKRYRKNLANYAAMRDKSLARAAQVKNLGPRGCKAKIKSLTLNNPKLVGDEGASDCGSGLPNAVATSVGQMDLKSLERNNSTSTMCNLVVNSMSNDHEPLETSSNGHSAATNHYVNQGASALSHTRFVKLIESRKKAAKMLIVIVIMFGLCYLPVHFLNILR